MHVRSVPKCRVLLLATTLLCLLFQPVKGADSMPPQVNLAKGLPYWVSEKPSDTYPDTGGELTDGIRAAATYTDRAWQGHLRNEFRAITIDLGAPKPIDRVTLGFLHEPSVGVYLPTQVLLYTSVNGRDWDEPVGLRRETFGVPAQTARKEVTFAGLNRTARYVRIVFFVEVWVFIDEVEVWGEDRVVDVGGPTDLLDLNDPYLGLTAPATAWEPFRLPEPEGVGAYFPAGSPEAAGVRHLMLIYTHSDWTLSRALPYVAYAPPPEGNRLAPARWTDWFFDSFLFLALVTPDRAHAFDAPSRGKPARWEHWLWFLDYLFTPDQQLDAFEQAVARVKTYIDDPDYKAKVVVMIPYPMPANDDFGDPFGTGTSLSFARFPQGAKAQFEARLKAVEAYLAEFDRRWRERNFQHLELVGLYWLAEEIQGEGDMQLLRAVADLAHQRGLKLFWIPYFTAAGWSQWREAGIDAAIYQPNYMFNTSIPESRLREAAERARRYGMGIEIEADETVLTSAAGRERYLAYLKAGAEYGFMTEALHGYYQGVDILARAFVARQADVRYLYDATYLYVKGMYSPED